jgi:hypothetical protein
VSEWPWSDGAGEVSGWGKRFRPQERATSDKTEYGRSYSTLTSMEKGHDPRAVLLCTPRVLTYA